MEKGVRTMKKNGSRRNIGWTSTLVLCLAAALWILAGCDQGAPSSSDPQSTPVSSNSPCSYDSALIRSVMLEDNSSLDYRITESRREIQTITDILNGFTYTSSQEMEDPPYPPRYSLTLYTDDWTYSCSFDQDSLYFYHEDSVVQYTGEEGCLQELVDLACEEWHTLFSIDPEDVSCISVAGFDFTLDDRETIEGVVSALNSFTYREVTTSEPADTGSFFTMGLLGPEGGAAQAMGFAMGTYYIRIQEEDQYVYYLGEANHFLETQQLLQNAPGPTKAPSVENNLNPQPTATPEPAKKNPLYQFETDQVKALRIEKDHPQSEEVEITSKEELAPLLELLNGFTYETIQDDALPDGYTYALEVEEADGTLTQITLTENGVIEDVYAATYLYTGKEGYFRPLLKLADQSLPPKTDPLFQLDSSNVEFIEFSLVKGRGTITLTDPQAINQVVQCLNEFDYTSDQYIPNYVDPSVEPIASLGEDHFLNLECKDGNSYYLTLYSDGVLLSNRGSRNTLFLGESGCFQEILDWEDLVPSAPPFDFDLDQVSSVTCWASTEDGSILDVTTDLPQEVKKTADLLNTFSPGEPQVLTEDEISPQARLSLSFTLDVGKMTLSLSIDQDRLYLPTKTIDYQVYQGQEGHFAPLIDLVKYKTPLSYP